MAGGQYRFFVIPYSLRIEAGTVFVLHDGDVDDWQPALERSWAIETPNIGQARVKAAKIQDGTFDMYADRE